MTNFDEFEEFLNDGLKASPLDVDPGESEGGTSSGAGGQAGSLLSNQIPFTIPLTQCLMEFGSGRYPLLTVLDASQPLSGVRLASQ